MAHPAAPQLVGESLYRRIRLIHWDHPVRPYVERAAAAALTLTALAVGASPAAAKPSLAVKAVTTSQKQALSKGTLDVRVRSSRNGKVRVNALARKTARGRVRVARSVRLRFRKAGRKTGHMHLTSGGRGHKPALCPLPRGGGAGLGPGGAAAVRVRGRPRAPRRRRVRRRRDARP